MRWVLRWSCVLGGPVLAWLISSRLVLSGEGKSREKDLITAR